MMSLGASAISTPGKLVYLYDVFPMRYLEMLNLSSQTRERKPTVEPQQLLVPYLSPVPYPW